MSERFEGDRDMAPMLVIWLQPSCVGCDIHKDRHWNEDEPDDCEECGRRPVKYTLTQLPQESETP